MNENKIRLVDVAFLFIIVLISGAFAYLTHTLDHRLIALERTELVLARLQNEIDRLKRKLEVVETKVSWRNLKFEIWNWKLKFEIGVPYFFIFYWNGAFDNLVDKYFNFEKWYFTVLVAIFYNKRYNEILCQHACTDTALATPLW